MLSPAARKVLLTIHLTLSVGWIGTVLAYLALGITAVNGASVAATRGAWTAMEVIGWYVISPLALASLLTGIGLGLGTKWGLFRHYWVVISFVLTLLATVVLLLHMPSVTRSAAAAQELSGQALDALGGDLLHPSVGLVVLIFVQVLNLYKPRGLTRYGWRKQQQSRVSR